MLLFIDEPKLNTTRLHRVLRNLCYHGPTRDWVVRSLLSILERSNEARITSSEALPITSTPSTKGKRITAKTATPTAESKVCIESFKCCVRNVRLDRHWGRLPSTFYCTATSALVDRDWLAGWPLGPFALNLLPYSDEYGSRPRLAGWKGIGAVCSQSDTVL